MKTESVIMVQIADREWTLEALHYACLLARSAAARIVLVAMVPVQHTIWLGSEWGYLNFTHQEQRAFADYQATIEDYGLEFTAMVMQYATLSEAIAQAAEHVNAQVVFARLPESLFPLWTRFEQWMLHRQLARQQRQWIQHPVYNTYTAVPVPEVVAQHSHP